MPVVHMIITGPMASGKSTLARHFAKNLPEGYVLKAQNALPGEAPNAEYWTLVIEKRKKRNGKKR